MLVSCVLDLGDTVGYMYPHMVSEETLGME